MMDKAIMFLVESIAISVVLYILYVLLFRGKASYRAQRILLLSIPVVATLLAVVSVDLIPVSNVDTRISVSRRITVDGTQLNSTRVEVNPLDFVIVRGNMDVESSIAPEMPIEQSTTPIWSYLPMVLWALVAFVLIVSFAVKLSRILRLRRLAAKTRMEGYTLYNVECDDVIFSFWRGIYVSRSIEGERLEFVICHELAHIRHRHHIDKLVVELYAILLWFNPIVRLIQRELSLLHEYEADHAVVTSGCDVVAYKHFIFDVVAAPVPAFSNGINSSQIKKRFIMMKRDYTVSHRVLRAIATAATFAFVIMASLVYVQAENVEPTETAEVVAANDDKPAADDSTIRRSNLTFDADLRGGDVMISFVDSLDGSVVKRGTTTFQSAEIIELTGLDPNKLTFDEFITALFTKVYLSNFMITNTMSKAVNITLDGDDAAAVVTESDSSDNVIAITRFNFKPLFKEGGIRGEKIVEFWTQFTNAILGLDANSDVVQSSDAIKSISSTVEDAMKMASAAMSEAADKAPVVKKETVVAQKPKVETMPLFRKDCQLVEFDNPNNYRGMYYTFVIRHKNYTQVDHLTNVNWSSGHWVSHGSLSYLLDKGTGDKYMINSIANGYPMDKTLVFRDLKDCTTVVTQIYPPLDKSVKVVDYVGESAPDAVYPSNSQSSSVQKLKVYESVDDLPYRLISNGEDARVIKLDEDFKLPKNDSKLYR